MSGIDIDLICPTRRRSILRPLIDVAYGGCDIGKIAGADIDVVGASFIVIRPADTAVLAKW